eukprot:179085-Chlamydomonas_euryale.AAC.2
MHCACGRGVHTKQQRRRSVERARVAQQRQHDGVSLKRSKRTGICSACTVSQSDGWSVGWAAAQSVGQTFVQSVDRPGSRPGRQSVSHTTSQSDNQAVGHSCSQSGRSQACRQAEDGLRVV